MSAKRFVLWVLGDMLAGAGAAWLLYRERKKIAEEIDELRGEVATLRGEIRRGAAP